MQFYGTAALIQNENGPERPLGLQCHRASFLKLLCLGISLNYKTMEICHIIMISAPPLPLRGSYWPQWVSPQPSLLQLNRSRLPLQALHHPCGLLISNGSFVHVLGRYSFNRTLDHLFSLALTQERKNPYPWLWNESSISFPMEISFWGEREDVHPSTDPV